MTNKDFIKLLLISVGCDKKYEIEVNRASDGSYVYDIYGEGEEEGVPATGLHLALDNAKEELEQREFEYLSPYATKIQ